MASISSGAPTTTPAPPPTASRVAASARLRIGTQVNAVCDASGTAGPSPAPSRMRVPTRPANPTTGSSTGSWATAQTIARPASSQRGETRLPSRPMPIAVTQNSSEKLLPTRPNSALVSPRSAIIRGPTRPRIALSPNASMT